MSRKVLGSSERQSLKKWDETRMYYRMAAVLFLLFSVIYTIVISGLAVYVAEYAEVSDNSSSLYADGYYFAFVVGAIQIILALVIGLISMFSKSESALLALRLGAIVGILVSAIYVIDSIFTANIDANWDTYSIVIIGTGLFSGVVVLVFCILCFAYTIKGSIYYKAIDDKVRKNVIKNLFKRLLAGIKNQFKSIKLLKAKDYDTIPADDKPAPKVMDEYETIADKANKNTTKANKPRLVVNMVKSVVITNVFILLTAIALMNMYFKIKLNSYTGEHTNAVDTFSLLFNVAFIIGIVISIITLVLLIAVPANKIKLLKGYNLILLVYTLILLIIYILAWNKPFVISNSPDNAYFVFVLILAIFTNIVTFLAVRFIGKTSIDSMN